MRIAVIDDERPARGELIWQLRELLGDVDFAERRFRRRGARTCRRRKI